MKFSSLLLALCLCASVQGQVSHDLTIYSVDGKFFTLYVDGIQQNENPSNKVEIVNTNKDYLKNVKIVFDDNTLAPIKKRFLQISHISPPHDQLPVVCTYRIVTRKGNYKIRFTSRINKKIDNKYYILTNDVDR